MTSSDFCPHGSVTTRRIGVLLTNLGTPQAPTTKATRRYLAEFLADPRVVELPRPLWWLILYGIILPFRAPRSAKLYQKIWTREGSPLRIILQKQAAALQKIFAEELIVIPAMRYGEPSLSHALQQLQMAQVRQLLLLPLYPQYSATTTATTFDAIAKLLRHVRWQPELRTISDYYDHPAYIAAVAESVLRYWQQHGQTEKLLISFHGLPKQFLQKGDPYYCFCHKTARLIAEHLKLSADQYQLSFQSRLGRAEWLQPYTDQTLKVWAEQGVASVTVVCPGFAADCLETLEEIDQLNRHIFLQAGGKSFHYVPALNDSVAHIEFLAQLIRQHIQGW